MPEKKVKRSIMDLPSPFPRQKLAYFAIGTHKFVLCGGASGGGKSQVIEWAPIFYLVDYVFRRMGVRGAEVGVFCETFGALEDRQIRRAKGDYPDWLGTWHGGAAGPHFELAADLGSGKILYRNLDRPEKYRSAQYAAIFIEEMSLNPPSVFHALRSRLGWPGLPHSPMVGATNPGGPMHGLLKRIFIDRQIPDELTESYDPEDFVYVPFGYKDNPKLPQARIDALNSLAEPLRSAMRDGNWDAFAGMFFPSYSRKALIVPTFEIPASWMLYGGLDPGWASPCSFGLYAVEPLHRQTGSGCVFRVGGYYEAGANSRQHAEAVLKWLTQDLRPWTGGRLPRQTFAGEDAFAHKDRLSIVSSEATMASEFLRVGLPLTHAVTARVPGWAQLRGMVDRRVLRFFDGLNEPVLAEMEAALGDDANPEDLKGRGHDSDVDDHGLDEMRYLFMSIYRPMMPAPKKPKYRDYGEEEEETPKTVLQRALGGRAGSLRSTFGGGRK